VCRKIEGNCCQNLTFLKDFKRVRISTLFEFKISTKNWMIGNSCSLVAVSLSPWVTKEYTEKMWFMILVQGLSLMP
jgi:hypothetical protein